MYNKIQKKIIAYILAFFFLLSIIIPVSSEKTRELKNVITNISDDVVSLIEKVNESLISYYLEKLV